jgi:hypothetical protein
MSEMDGAILRSLERFVGQLVQGTWEDLTESLGTPCDPLDFSGIHRLGAPRLLPYLEQPGVFLIFGPLPEVRILHLEASQTAMHGPLSSRLIPGPEWSWGWRWESDTSPLPTFAACAAMGGHWTLVPALKTLLARCIAPLQAAYGDSFM